MSTENSDTEQPTPSPSPSPGSGIDFIFGRRRRRRRSTSTTTTTSSSTKTIGSYTLGSYSNITYNGNIVRQMQLNGKTIWNQPALDVELMYVPYSPLSWTGAHNYGWLSSASRKEKRIYNSNGHIVCVVYAPGGKVTGVKNGMPIQNLKLKWNLKRVYGAGHCWMSGKTSNYFQYQSRAHKKETCGSCRHPLTGWHMITSSHKSSKNYANVRWFSSFRLHDGNRPSKMEITVSAGEHKFFSNENQAKITIYA